MDKPTKGNAPYLIGFIIGLFSLIIGAFLFLLSMMCLCSPKASEVLASFVPLLIGITLIIFCGSKSIMKNREKSGAQSVSKRIRSYPIIGGSLILVTSVVALIFILIFWKYGFSSIDEGFKLTVLSWTVCSFVGIIGGVFSIGKRFYLFTIISALTVIWASIAIYFVIGFPIAILGTYFIASGRKQFK